MRILLDISSFILFFALYYLYDMYVATITLMVVMATYLPIDWAIQGKVDKNDCLMLATVLVFGAATIYFHNDFFIKCKLSIIYSGIFSTVYIRRWLEGKPFSVQLFNRNGVVSIHLDDRHWNRIDMTIMLLYGATAVINLLVAFYCSTPTWLLYKLCTLITLKVICFGLIPVYMKAHAILPTVHSHNEENDAEQHRSSGCTIEKVHDKEARQSLEKVVYSHK